MAVKSKKYSAPLTRGQIKWRTAGAVVLFLVSLIIAGPAWANKGLSWINQKTNIGLPLVPQSGFNLGLDLQGGAHLIYEANTKQITTTDKAGAVEGVRDVIERRVRGGLGVTEPLVQTTKVGDSYRIIVELPGVTDVKTAIKMIGDTPVLEFKEENHEPQRDLTAAEQKQMNEYNAGVIKTTSVVLAELAKGVDFAEVASKYSEDEKTKNNGGDLGYLLPESSPEMYNWAKAHQDGETSKEVIKTGGGLNIIKRISERKAERVEASHLLICYQGAEQCDNSPYTKSEAKAKIEEIKKEITAQNFEEMVKKYSTEPGASNGGGYLGKFKKGDLVPEFEQVVWPQAIGTVAGPVETKFGFHLILKKGQETISEYQIARIFLKLKSKEDIVPVSDQWKSTGLSGKQLKKAEVTEDQSTGQIQVSLNFNSEGTKLFADITTRNVNKQVAIFLDNQPISEPRVNEPILNGNAVISGGFSFSDAKLLAQRLNSGALPVPVELISQQTVDATLGVGSLQKSFKAGVVGLLLVMLFMVIYYRLPGLLSVFSLIVYAALNLAVFKLIGVTITLAGIAGFILSIGMAVDANVLQFERLKEELRLGKSLRSAAEECFSRAWPSIRDGHITGLISCALLIWFGSGFIQGFAVILAIGTLVSLFTAITITRTIVRFVFGYFGDRANWMFLGRQTAPLAPVDEKK